CVRRTLDKDGVASPYQAERLSDCANENAANLVQVDPVGNTYQPHTLALVTQSARGELAVVDALANVLVDTRPNTPGFGFVPVGLLPEHVRASEDGCLAVTANTDSCDLAAIDVPTLFNDS